MFKKISFKIQKGAAVICILGMLFIETYPVSVHAQEVVAGEFVPEELLGASDIGAAAEASQSKQKGASVKVAFSSDRGFRNGSRVTAIAAPGGFIDGMDTSNLYFTWYLKKNGCDLENNVGSNNSCDLDRDGDITENDWKIAAARVIVRGNFDWQSASYSGSSAGGGVEAEPRDWDDEDAPNCYIQGPNSGIFYELREVESDFENSCASGYHRACVRDYNDTTCTVPNPDYDPDLIPPDTDPPTIDIDNLRSCRESSRDTDNMVCRINSDTQLRDFEASPYCPNGGAPVCMPNGGGNLDGSSVTNDGNSSNDHAIFGTAGTNLCTFLGTNIAANINANPPSYFGQSNNATCTSGLNALGYSEPTCSFEMGENNCKHLFLEYTDEIGLDDEEVGDGEFGIAEKRFWGADPNSTSTNGRQRDEAAVMGLGVDRITWTYSEGDEIGVAVEGITLMPTKHRDSSYIRTWAFSKGECSALEEMEEDDDSLYSGEEDEDEVAARAFYVEHLDNGDIGILTTNLDLNDCLEDNLLDPRDSDNGLTNMRVDVEANPTNPINDSDGIVGDTVTVTASVQHADVNNMLFRWAIDLSRDGDAVPTDETSWRVIDEDEFSSHSEFEGVGKRQLRFLLNLDEDVVGDDEVFYLRARVTASEQVGSGTNIARGHVIIKVKQSRSNIGAYLVTPHSDGTLSLNEVVPICSGDGMTANGSCYVTKNEIVGLRIAGRGASNLSSITWEINGQPFTCSRSISSDCSRGNVLFFPVLGEPGEGIIVVAKGVDERGETVEIKKYFIITESMIGIISADESNVWRKLLGYRKFATGPNEADYSNKIFETHMGNTIRLARTGDITGYNFSWIIDGLARDEFFNQREISFPVNKIDGESYTVSVTPIYDPSQDVLVLNKRKALQAHWGITAVNDISLENIESDTIQINVVDTPNIIGATKGSMLASLATHLPGQIVFLLEITLTAFALLLFSSLLFALMPESILTKKTK